MWTTSNTVGFHQAPRGHVLTTDLLHRARMALGYSRLVRHH